MSRAQNAILSRVAAVLFAVAMPAASFAATINFMGTGKGEVVSIHSPSLGNVSVRAGELLWSAGSPSELPLLFYAYCVDPNHWLSVSQSITVRRAEDLDTLWVEDAGGKAAWLIRTYAPTIHASGTNTDAAAPQIAVWGAMYNASGNLTEGPFRLNSGGPVATLAPSLLNTVFTGPAGVQTANAAWLDTTAGQDQMIPTPEPATFILMGTGLIAAWRIARRKREE